MDESSDSEIKDRTDELTKRISALNDYIYEDDLRSILTKQELEYLLDIGEDDGSDTEFRMRKRILMALIDMNIIDAWLPESEREKILGNLVDDLSTDEVTDLYDDDADINPIEVTEELEQIRLGGAFATIRFVYKLLRLEYGPKTRNLFDNTIRHAENEVTTWPFDIREYELQQEYLVMVNFNEIESMRKMQQGGSVTKEEIVYIIGNILDRNIDHSDEPFEYVEENIKKRIRQNKKLTQGQSIIATFCFNKFLDESDTDRSTILHPDLVDQNTE